MLTINLTTIPNITFAKQKLDCINERGQRYRLYGKKK